MSYTGGWTQSQKNYAPIKSSTFGYLGKKTKQKQPNLGAVGDDEERLAVDHECLDVVGFADLQDVDVLDLDELVGGRVALVDVRAAEQLRHDDEEVVVDHHGLADHSGGA